MPMFPPSGPQAAVPPIPMQLGLLPNPADPRTYPAGMMRLGMGGQRESGAAGRGGATRGREERPAYTPEQVIKSQQSIADWFQSRPPAAYNVPGYIGTAGNAFMGTFIPTRAEERVRENERISSDTARRAGSATTLDEAIAALTGGDPQQRNAGMSARLEALDPARKAQIALAEAQARAATRQMELEDNLFGGGPNQGPAAAPQQGGGFHWPDLSGVRPDANTNQGMVVPPPEAPQQPPFPGRMNLGGPVPQPEQMGAEPLATPAQALMDQSVQAAQRQAGGQQQPAAPATAPNSLQSARDMFLRLSPLDQAAVRAQFKKDPAKAVQMIQQIADPRGAQASVVAREAAEAEGKMIGQARFNLPTALQSGESIIRNIDEIIGNEHLPSVVGPIQGALPSIRDASTDLEARIQQLQGQAFLQAFQNLRGGGQITEAEGAKASAAIARLGNMRQSDAGYLQALHDARFEIHELTNLARVKAGQRPLPYTPYVAPPKKDKNAPAPGELPDVFQQQGQRPGPGAGPPTISDPAEAMRLPPGTQFRTPDGRLKVRP